MKQDRFEQLQKLLNQSPNDPFLIYAIALEYVGKQDDYTAAKYFEQLITDHPDYLATYYQLAQLKERTQDFDRALTLYEQGIAVAAKVGQHKALRELQSALNILQDELED